MSVGWVDAFRLPEWRPGYPSPHRTRSPAHAHGAGLLKNKRARREKASVLSVNGLRHQSAQISRRDVDSLGGFRLDVRFHAHAVVDLAVRAGDPRHVHAKARVPGERRGLDAPDKAGRARTDHRAAPV